MRFQVLFHSPQRSAFHLSLTVLFTIGRQVVFSLGRWSSRIPAGFLVSCGTWEHSEEVRADFVYGAVTLFGRPFQCRSTIVRFCNFPKVPQSLLLRPTTPRIQRLRPLTHPWFGLFPVRSPLLGESLLISVPAGTKMFQFPAFASAAYVFSDGWPGFTRPGCPIQKSPDHSLFSGSPRLIAANHAFHRLLSPRHPPHALSSLTT